MNQVGSYDCGGKWLDSESLQMGKSGFLDRQDVGVRKEE